LEDICEYTQKGEEEEEEEEEEEIILNSNSKKHLHRKYFKVRAFKC